MLTDFPGKRPDEHVLMVIRKHPIVYIRITVVFLLTSLLPVAIFIFVWSAKFPLDSGGTTSIIGYLVASLFLLYSMAIVLIAWLDEEFDLFILTDNRLIDVTQVSFLKRTVATTPLSQIQDTTSNIQGVMGTLLNYGSIDIQTAAGDASSFNIDHVADPAMIARRILNYAQQSQGSAYATPPIGEAQAQTFRLEDEE